MTKINFSVPGIPRGKERPRFSRKTGRVYTPKPTLDYEKAVFQRWKLAAPNFVPHHGPVLIRFTAIFPIPASWPKAAIQAAHDCQMYHLGTPDFDNLGKMICDALNPPPADKKLGIPSDPFGHPWFNDGQVMGGGVKRYGSPPRLDVTLEFIDQPGGIMMPSEAKREEKAVAAHQAHKNALRPARAKPVAKATREPRTPLERAIAAADARDAMKGRE